MDKPHRSCVWVNSQLLPYLPQISVVIMDSASHHCMQEDKAPTKFSLKGDLIKWLKKGFKLVEFSKPREKSFRTDTKLATFGHTVLQLS
jgi:hypothetical protein